MCSPGGFKLDFVFSEWKSQTLEKTLQVEKIPGPILGRDKSVGLHQEECPL